MRAPPSPKGEGKGRAAFGTTFAFCTRSLCSVARSTRSLDRDDKDEFCFQRSFGSLRSIRMTGKRAGTRAAYAARDRNKLSIIASSILEKGKTTLLPFSPYCEELHAERVNLRGVFNPAV